MIFRVTPNPGGSPKIKICVGAGNKMTGDDFEFLVMGRRELMEMNILKQKGMTLIDLDKLKTKQINQIIKTAFVVI